MKLKAIRSFRHGATTIGRGKAIELPDPIAKDLIIRGLVASVGVVPTARKKRQPKPAPQAKPASPDNQ